MVWPRRSSIQGLVLGEFSRFWLRFAVSSTGATLGDVPFRIRFQLGIWIRKVTGIRHRLHRWAADADVPASTLERDFSVTSSNPGNVAILQNRNLSLRSNQPGTSA